MRRDVLAQIVALVTAALVPLTTPAAAQVEEGPAPLEVTDYTFHSAAILPAAALSLTILDMDPDAVDCTFSMGMATRFFRRGVGSTITVLKDGMPYANVSTWANGLQVGVLGVGTHGEIAETVYQQAEEVTGIYGGEAKSINLTPKDFRLNDLRGDLTFSVVGANLHPYAPEDNPVTGPDTMRVTLHCSEPVEILLHASQQALIHSQATFDSALLYTELMNYAHVVMGAESQRTFQGERVEVSAGMGRVEPQPLWEGALQVDGPGVHDEWDFYTDELYWTRSGEPGTYTFTLNRRVIRTDDHVPSNLWLLAVGWQNVPDLAAVLELPGFPDAPSGTSPAG